MDMTIEMAPFTLADNIDEDALMAASDRLEREFLARADGYLGRVLVRRDDKNWSDIVFWKTADHAERAMKNVPDSQACRQYFQCMMQADHDQPDGGVTLFRAMRRYGSLSAID